MFSGSVLRQMTVRTPAAVAMRAACDLVIQAEDENKPDRIMTFYTSVGTVANDQYQKRCK